MTNIWLLLLLLVWMCQRDEMLSKNIFKMSSITFFMLPVHQDILVCCAYLHLTYMLHHSVLQVLPPFLSLFCVREDVCGGAVRWALSQLLAIILHQGGPAHQLHSGELLQKLPTDREGKQWKFPCAYTLQYGVCTLCQCALKLLLSFPLTLQRHNNLYPQKNWGLYSSTSPGSLFIYPAPLNCKLTQVFPIYTWACSHKRRWLQHMTNHKYGLSSRDGHDYLMTDDWLLRVLSIMWNFYQSNVTWC